MKTHLMPTSVATAAMLYLNNHYKDIINIAYPHILIKSSLLLLIMKMKKIKVKKQSRK